MRTQAWNILGLLCATAGVLLLFRYGMPYRVRRGGESLLALNQRDLDDLKQERLYDGLGWVGLVLILLGTLFQVIANTCFAQP